MTVDAIIAEIEALSEGERSKVFAFLDQIRATDDSWVPESFKKGMADLEAGRIVDPEIVFRGDAPPQ